MLISLSGRKLSGKSFIAEDLELNHGFSRVGFADYLKRAVAKLYGWEVSWLYHPIKKEELLEEKVKWDKETARRFSEIVEQEIPVVIEAELESIRHALTHIGTAVLREIDPDFHVKKTLLSLKSEDDIVLEDVRFKNEIEAIRKFVGSISLFIIRPYNFNYSNHSSEISLNRKDFQNVIINNGTKEHIINKFYDFLNSGNCEITSNDCFYNPTKDSCFWAGMLASCAKLKNNKLEVMSERKYLLEKLVDFIKCSCEIEENENKFIFNIDCPYIIEDLKLWNLYDNKIPDCIKDNEDMLRYWYEGRQCR